MNGSSNTITEGFDSSSSGEKVQKENTTNRLLAIVGPTASGKSTLAVRVAESIDAEIVNCDSMQMYRFLDIGTAKPDPEDQKRIPHHLYDVIAPDEYYSAGRYMTEARKICREIAARGKAAVIVGGTGLYLRALLEGVFEGPGRSREIRQRLDRIARRKGLDALHRLLERKDPRSARRISRADRMRIVRALEVYFLTGKPISRLHRQRRRLRDFSVVKSALKLPREILYDRINCRVERMYRSGLIEEVEHLLDKGFSPNCKGFEALGYRYALRVSSGELTRREGIELTQRDTRRYAKRQMTWFRKEEDVHWIDGPGEDPLALEQLLTIVRERWNEEKFGPTFEIPETRN